MYVFKVYKNGSGSLKFSIQAVYNFRRFANGKCSNTKIHVQFVVYIPAAEIRDCIFRYSRNNFHNATRYFHKECYAENVKIRFSFRPYFVIVVLCVNV